jgi:anti-sigma factor RsiW
VHAVPLLGTQVARHQLRSRRSSMQNFQRQNPRSLFRRVAAPAFAVAALAISAQAALAWSDGKPELKVEAERSPQGAKLIFKGKGWAPGAKIKITGSRAPGSSTVQDFGTFDADTTGGLTGRKVVGCTTPNMEDGQNETVTVTAVDLATPASKVTVRVPGGAWVCL